ncbi:hypothetical protein MTR_0036s0320 [Medicago truncatula]|uniref:Uncharacterized protein n=3 Tax=Medicago truncatula TaxID=3880 RepID=A0A072TI03_MEDTR|nr:hypothetical protein MTR_0036s0320 [Medicago truncatula]
MYHFSMFHASHHIVPVSATKVEVEAEASSVETVASKLCPLKIVLDRVVLTSTGVLLGCWQVISGSDPITIRSRLKNALPRAPEKQLYDAAILHTTFARLLGPPRTSFTELLKTSNELQFFHELVNQLNSQFQGFEVCGYLFVCFIDGRIKIVVEDLSSLNIIGKSLFHLGFFSETPI